MKAGVAQICITPPVGVDLCGYAARQQPSIGVLDDLYVRALYLEEGAERLLWLHCDLIGFTREWAGQIKAGIMTELGLVGRQIILSATHTHSGPATLPLRGCGRISKPYLVELERRLQQAARQAAAAPEPVSLRLAEGRCALGRDRRPPSIHSHTDHRLAVLALARPDDDLLLALLANYPIHHVALSPGNRFISADVAGAAVNLASRRLPGQPVALLTNGACGNISLPQLSAEPALMAQYGQSLGEALAATAAGAQSCDGTPLLSILETVSLPLAAPTRRAVLAAYDRACPQVEDPLWLGPLRDWRDETLALLKGPAPDSLLTDLQIVRIGPATFVAMGAEVFSRMADELRAAHTPRTYVVGYANGNLGYLPFREIYAEGGYEVDMAYKFYGHFMVAAGGYERLRDRAITLLRQVGEQP